MRCNSCLCGSKGIGQIFGKSICKKLLKNKVAPLIAKIIGGLAGAALNISVGKLGSLLCDNAWSFTSLGGLASFVLYLAIDGKVNGIIYSW